MGPVSQVIDAENEEAFVLVCSDSGTGNRLARIMRRTVGRVSVAESLDAVGSTAPIIAVYYDGLSEGERRALLDLVSESEDAPTVLLLSSACKAEELAQLFEARALTNMLVVHETGPVASDLLTTVQKMRRNEIFGLEKYFGWGVETHHRVMSTSNDRNAVICEIERFAKTIGVPSRLRSLIGMVADELITNAVYNAPVLPDGSRCYASQPRTVPVELTPGQEVVIRYCCDGVRFGISSVDPFGSLSPELVQDYLARGYRRGPDQVSSTAGGAGLGLYQIMDSLSHFVINIEKGSRTEMIGLVDVSGNYRRFAAAGKSFNLFVMEREP